MLLSNHLNNISNPLYSDEYFMKEAIKEAKVALEKDEVPVGAIIVISNKIIARSHNLVETLNDATAHAEMQSLTSAQNYINGKYLQECTLYVTLEPCIMCAGALFWTQLGRLVYGASDPKRGFKSSQLKILHPSTKIKEEVLDSECSAMLKSFFKTKR